MGAKSSKVAPDNVTSVDAVRIIHVLPAASPIDELQSSRTASSVWEQSITYLEEEEEEEELDPRDDVASSQSYLDSDSESCFEVCQIITSNTLLVIPFFPTFLFSRNMMGKLPKDDSGSCGNCWAARAELLH